MSIRWFTLGLSQQEMATLTFVMRGFAGQRHAYVLHERGRLCRSRPAPIMAFASLCDITLMGCLAAFGLLMRRLPQWTIGMLLSSTLIFTLEPDQAGGV